MSSDNFSTEAPKGATVAKAATAVLVRIAMRGVTNFALHYVICLPLTWIVSQTLLHDRLDVPLATVGVVAIGMLYRWFRLDVKQLTRQQAPQLAAMEVPFDPALLDSLLSQYRTNPADSATGAAKASPYL